MIVFGGFSSRTTTEIFTVGVDEAWTLYDNSNPYTGGYAIGLANVNKNVFAIG